MSSTALAVLFGPDGMAMDKRGGVTLAKGNITVLKSRFVTGENMSLYQAA